MKKNINITLYQEVVEGIIQQRLFGLNSEITAEVMRDMRKRIDLCIASNGRNLKDIIFKKYLQ